jgi:beta-lactamase regulating signal transducer with metallopeptidase domain
MTVAIIVYILIVTVPLIAAAALTEKLLRLWSLPVRGAWAVTALLIALIGGRTVTQQLIAPHAPLSVTGINIAATGQTTPTASTSFALATLRELMFMPRTAAAYASHLVGPTPNISLAILWLIMSGVMLALIFVVYSRVRHARQQWSFVDFAGHRVRVAPNTGPAVVGIFRPEIVVPRWMLDGHPDDSQLIIMHEMEHRCAHDPVLLAAMWGLVALFPWHPGAWYCLARIRLAIEIDCDARVVGKGASLKNYAQLLVNQARARLGAPTHLWLGATSLLEPASHLERRLRAMVTPDNKDSAKQPYMRALRSASYIALVSTLAIAACESHVPTAADISGLDATSAQKNVRQVFTTDGQQPTFYVNGVAVSAEKAKAISAGSIATINVVRSKQPGGEQQIRLVTVSDSALGQKYVATTPSGTKQIFFVKRDTATTAGGTVLFRRTGEIRLMKTPGAEPLFVINGVIATTAQYKALNPANIESVEVLKGAAAIEQYSDPRAKNGVVSITLKQ